MFLVKSIDEHGVPHEVQRNTLDGAVNSALSAYRLTDPAKVYDGESLLATVWADGGIDFTPEGASELRS